MTTIDKFLFSKNERKLITALNEVGERPREIMRKIRIPHASLYLAFKKLHRRGFVQRSLHGGKIYWKKIGLLHDELSNSETHTKVVIHTTIDEVKKSVNQILMLQGGERVTIVEGTQNNSGWFELFTKQETIALNKALSNKRIICESILPESYFRDALRHLGDEWALSYKSRPIITYVVKRDLISSDAILISFKNRIILLYLKETLAIEIQNKDIVSLINGMILAIKDNARKVTIEDDFSFTPGS